MVLTVDPMRHVGLAVIHPKLSPPPETGRAHRPSAATLSCPPTLWRRPPPPPPPGGGEGSASTRSTPIAVEFVHPFGVPIMPLNGREDWESEGSNAWIPSGYASSAYVN
jgi:hypothetical protein